MLDWKILAAGFVALIFVSSLMVGSMGLGDIFSQITDKIAEWLQNSPFSGFDSVVPTTTGDKNIDIVFFPSTLSLSTEGEVNISSPGINLNNFRGEIFVNYPETSIVYREANSQLTLSSSVMFSSISGLSLKTLRIEDVKFIAYPNLTIENGTVEIQNFIGQGLIEADSFHINGTSSKISITAGDSTWELS